MTNKVLNVGLVAFGLSGRYFHAPFLSTNPNFKLKTVVERSKNEAQEFDSSIENARSIDELLADDSIDLVFYLYPQRHPFSICHGLPRKWQACGYREALRRH